jgi:hypothetical protein
MDFLFQGNTIDLTTIPVTTLAFCGNSRDNGCAAQAEVYV